MQRAVYLGIDLTASAKKPSAYCMLDTDLTIVEWDAAGSDAGLNRVIQRLNPAVTGIDAPLTLPAGLCCLEPECACTPVSPSKGRQVERMLSRMGIASYYCSKQSAIKLLIYRGMALSQAWTASGYQVIEIYPYASKVRLFGKNALPRKSSRAGRHALLDGMGAVLGRTLDLPRVKGVAPHDMLDALVAAYSVWLYAHNRAAAVGDPDEGVIWIPIAGGNRQLVADPDGKIESS